MCVCNNVTYSFSPVVFVVHVAQGDPCRDLDPQGCAANPNLCLDDLLAVVTCPVTCHKCRKCLITTLLLIVCVI